MRGGGAGLIILIVNSCFLMNYYTKIRFPLTILNYINLLTLCSESERFQFKKFVYFFSLFQGMYSGHFVRND